MITHLHDMVTVIHDVRWILVLIAGLTLGALLALVISDRNALEQENAELAADNDRLRANQRPQVVALRPRGGVAR